MKLAIAILNYNSQKHTIELLQSIKQSTIPDNLNIEIAVVDNNSKDTKLGETIKDQFPNIYFYQTGENLGFAAGMNYAVDKLSAFKPTHYLLLNPDLLIPDDFFVNLTQSAINDPKVGLVSPLIYFTKGYEYESGYSKDQLGKVIWSAGGSFDWDNILGSNAHVNKVDKGQFKKPQPTDFATGACLLIKKEVIDQIGLFNKRYFMYLEDVDFSQRVKQTGWQVIFDPSIKLSHKVSQSSGIGSSLNDYFLTRNRLLFGFKFARLRTKFALCREAVKKLFSGTPAQKLAVKDFFTLNLGPGSYFKKRSKLDEA